jgi:PPP family 3-phenylpropionic acid transporter
MKLLPFQSVYFSLGLSFGVLNPFLSVIFTHDGLSTSVYGTVIAIGMIIATVAQPVWGVVADRTGNIRLLLVLMSIVPIVFVKLLNVHVVLLLVVVVALYLIFKSSQPSLTDTYTIAATEHLGPVYGKVRYFQSVGYGVGGYIAGFYIHHHSVASLWWLYVVVALVATFTVFFLPPSGIKKISSATSITSGARQLLLANKKSFLIFLLGMFLVNGTLAAYNTYLPVVYVDLGGSLSSVGLAVLVGAVANVPAMLWANRLIVKMGPIPTMMIGASLFFLRWVLEMVISNPTGVILVQVLHGSFGLVYVAAVHYVSVNSPREIRATAQTLFGTVAGNVAGIAGNVIDGILLQVFGYQMMYAASAATVVVGFLCLIYVSRISRIQMST